MDRSARDSVTAHTLAFVAAVCVYVYLAWTADWGSFLVWLWCGAGAIASIVFLRHLIATARWCSLCFTFGPDALLITHRGGVDREIPYAEIAGYRFNSKDPREWLTINLEGGRPPVMVPHYPLAGSAASLAKEFVRGIGPKLPAKVDQDRGVRPPSVVDGLIWDQFGNPHPVPMRVGIRYRYINPDELRGKFKDAFNPMITGLPVLPSMIKAFEKGDRSAGLFLMFGVVILLTSLWGRRISCSLLMRKVFQDEFELRSDVLVVYRGDRTLVFPTPGEWTKGTLQFRFDGRPVLRFRRGLRFYYLDPRFIEPCH